MIVGARRVGDDYTRKAEKRSSEQAFVGFRLTTRVSFGVRLIRHRVPLIHLQADKVLVTFRHSMMAGRERTLGDNQATKIQQFTGALRGNHCFQIARNSQHLLQPQCLVGAKQTDAILDSEGCFVHKFG